MGHGAWLESSPHKHDRCDSLLSRGPIGLGPLEDIVALSEAADGAKGPYNPGLG
jgi:hypothetical protein